MFLSSFILFGVTYYGHNITSLRLKVIDEGSNTMAEVAKITSGRGGRTFFVTMNDNEYDGGQKFGKYADMHIGQKITIKYLPDVKYVVAEGVSAGDYRNMIIFQYLMFGASIILFLLPVLSWASPTVDDFLTYGWSKKTKK